MPRGQYPRTKRTTKEEIKAFVMFCLRDDIAHQLEQTNKPHLAAVKLYEQETGLKIDPYTAKRQAGRWILLNGVLCETKN